MTSRATGGDMSEKLNNSVTSLLRTLKDPDLPTMEMQVFVCVSVQGRT